ncbi:DUF6880 family protein [Methylomarinum vadi]|uniref:DUF6880 family protein n=1 Tax=Methylomarinum vadi TaxID=438855 RepID=UPI001268C943|nr:DUF6880 family protein [Methylomarinum vadi]
MNEENQLAAGLAELKKDALVEFIASLYGEFDTRIDQRIERLLLSEDSEALVDLSRQQIENLKRGRTFYDYYETDAFGDEIQQLLAEIEHHILPNSPERALALLDALLDTAANSLERCDDSDGYVGGLYQQACLLWLQAAKRCPAPSGGWLERVKDMAENNDYAVFDPLLPNAHLLLSQEELRQLAFFYETGLRKTLAQHANDSRYLSWKVNLQGVAEALKDTELYRRSIVLVSPQPNQMQLDSLARFYMLCDDYKGALQWLTEPWPTTGWRDSNCERLTLLAQCYEALNQPQQQRDALRARLELSPTYENLQSLLPLVAKDEAERLRQMAIDLAMQKDSAAKLELLLKLEEFDLAQQSAVADREELAQCHYMTLSHLLGITPANSVLLRVVLQRCLLDDILNRGKSQAYRYAADYLKALRKLDEQKPEYDPLISHLLYEQQLRQQHGRKRSFWPLVG